MNAHADTLPVARTPAHRTHRFALLLRREFWEHKGGFMWAPFIAGAISLVLTMVFIVIAHVAAGRVSPDAEIMLDDGSSMSINGLDLGVLTSQLSPQDKLQLANGIDVTMLLSSSWPFIVLAFVMFFYCLGALYDERKDRSVLFWKSLPVSDGETVLSKVVSVALVAPVLATLAAIATMFAFLAMLSVVVMFHGGNAWELIWGPGSPATLALQLLAAIPVYALWALPTIGWLMLCSVWSRSKPFLWALMVPVLSGTFVSMFGVMRLFNADAGWFWTHVVARMLLGVVPITPMDIGRLDGADLEGPGGMSTFIGIPEVYSNLQSPSMWIGAAAGIAMLYAATRLRRWRDDG
jgi:ABC-2 type transport system permease protein